MKVKLIRDNSNISCGTARPANTIAGKMLGLSAKLHEEAAELLREPTDLSEYGDVLEVLFEIGQLHGIEYDQMVEAAHDKERTHGGFNTGRIWMRDVPERGDDWPPKDLGGYANGAWKPTIVELVALGPVRVDSPDWHDCEVCGEDMSDQDATQVYCDDCIADLASE